MRLRAIVVVAAMLMVTAASQASVSTSYDLSTNPTATLSGTQSLASLTLTGSGTLTINGSGSPTVNYGDYTYLSVGTGQTINNTGNVAWNITTGDYLWDTWDSYFRIVGGSWTGTSTVNCGGGALYFDSAYSGGAYHGATVTGTHTFNAGYVFLDGYGTSLTGTYTINIDTSYGIGDEGFYISDEGNFFGSAYPASYGYSATTFAPTGGTINCNGGAVYVGRGSFLGSGMTINGDVWVGSGKFMGNHTINGSLHVTSTGLGNAPNNQVGWYWYPTGAALVSPSSIVGTVGTMTVGGSATLDSNTTLQFQLGGSGINDRMTVTGAVNLGQDTHTPLALNILPVSGFYIAPGGGSLSYTLITGSSITGTVAIGASADLAGKIYSYTPTYTSTTLGLTVSRLSGASLWLGTGGNTNFSTTGNWDNGVPSGSLNAGVDLGGSNTITMNAPATFASLSFGGTGNWTINGGSALNATQLYYADSGASTISAPLSADLTVTTGALTISGAMSGNMTVSAGSLTVNGSSAGMGNINVTGSGSMVLNAPLSGSGSITVNTSGSPAMTMSGPQYYTGTTTVNNGYLTVTGDMGAGNVIIDASANTYAVLSLQGGTIGAGNPGSVVRLVSGSGGYPALWGWGTIDRNVEWTGTGGGYIGNSGAVGTTLTINGNLTISTTGAAYFDYSQPTVINGNLTSSVGTLNNSGNVTVSGLTNVYSFSNTGIFNALGGLIVGSGNFNFDPTPANIPSYMKSSIGGTLTWAGTLGTGSGWISVMNNSELSAVSSFTLGSPGGIGHIYITDDGNGANDNSTAITPSITLSGEGGELFNNTWVNCGWPNSGSSAATPFTGAISGSGNLFLGMGYVTTLAGSSDNTYTGDTKVLGWANVLTGAQALKGNVTVIPGAWLTLTSVNNVDPAKSVYVGSIRFASPMMDQLGSVGVLNDFVPNIAPNSSGSLALEANLPNSNYSNGSTGSNINASLAAGSAQLGDGYMYLSGPAVQGGRPWGEIFTGTSIQPGLDHVVRFWMNNSGFTLDAPGNAGALADVGGATAVEISTGPNWGMVGLGTNDNNTFSGTLTINPNVQFSGWASASGSPFGAATGDVYLNGGGLALNSWSTAPAVAAKHDLYLQGQTAIFFGPQDSNQKTLMSFNSIVRNNNAIFAISTNNNGAIGGSNVQLTLTNAPANQDSGRMAPAYFVDYAGRNFLVYDATNGFMPAVFTATDSFGANDGTDIVNLTNTASTTIPSGAKVWALRTAGALTGGDITIGSGGLILAGAPTSPTGKSWGGPNNNLVSTTNINFGSAEGIIYTGMGKDPAGIDTWYSGWNELDGTISGTGGLTIGGPFYGNGAPYLFISSNNSTTLSGPVTINMGLVKISNGGALGTGTITLNGGTGNNGNCVMGALASNSPPWNHISLSNSIYIGPNGGTFLMDYASGYFDLHGQISGPGTLAVTGNGGDPVYLYSSGNTWSGGTYINGGSLQVQNGANIGPGQVLVTGGGNLVLNGTTNTNSTNDIALLYNWGYGFSTIYVTPTTATIGALSGTGNVVLSYNRGGYQAASPITLTFGNAGSTEFYGSFQGWLYNNYYNQGGNIVYAGTGTFTLWGQDARPSTSSVWAGYSATTTINSGTFTNNGTLAGTGVTVSGGLLNGSGAVNAPLTVNSGGTLGGALAITGNVTSVGTINAAGTITGNLSANAGTVAGTTAVTGNFTVGGALSATVTGQHAIGGNLAVNYGGFTADPGTTIGSLNVTDSGTFAGSSTIAGATQNAGAISGTHTFGGNYTQTGAAASFGGASTFGTVGSPVAVAVNEGSFSGNNTIYGAFTTGAGSDAVVATHNGVTAGTLTVVGSVAFDHSTTLNFNLGQVGTLGGGVNDLIAITGDLSLDGTLNVNALTNFGPGTYTLFTYTGALTEPNGGLTLGTMPAGGYTYSFTSGTLHSGSVTTYEINLNVVTPWQLGDTNEDGAVNSLDIDAIYKHFGAADTSQWKVATDGLPVGQQDVTYELHAIFHTNYADANLDKKTDFVDFQVLLDHWQASGPSVGWAQGDFDGSGTVDFLDFQKLLDYWNPGGWSFAPAQAPEPASLTLILLGGLALLRRRRK